MRGIVRTAQTLEVTETLKQIGYDFYVASFILSFYGER